jgi:predicted RNase H-like nuclease (RuvC/YqgF family)
MYGIQDKVNQILRGAETIRKNSMKTETPRTDAYNNSLSVVPADFARQLERELAASEAEVERLKEELAAWDYGTRAKREQERAEKAEAEVERLRKQLATAHEELCHAGLRDYGN